MDVVLRLHQLERAIEPRFRSTAIEKEVHHPVVQLELARQQRRRFRLILGDLQQLKLQQRSTGIERGARLQSPVSSVEEEVHCQINGRGFTRDVVLQKGVELFVLAVELRSQS